MFTSISTLALAASWLLLQVRADTSSSVVVSISTPTTTIAMNAMTSAGCYATPAPLVDHGSYIFQSSGNCQGICYELGNTVMGLVNGTNCYCGNLLPPTDSQVSTSNCDTPCAGIDTDVCGGDNYWLVYLTGITKNKIQHLDPASLSSASSSKTSTSNAAPATVVVTASSDAKNSSSGGGTSKVGIAVGVVVGIVAIVGLVAGVFFFLRHKRRREAEEEYRRQAAVNSFVNGGKGHNSTPSLNDSRLDPDMIARRESTGTINDTQDYSRRILKIRNPDDF